MIILQRTRLNYYLLFQFDILFGLFTYRANLIVSLTSTLEIIPDQICTHRFTCRHFRKFHCLNMDG